MSLMGPPTRGGRPLRGGLITRRNSLFALAQCGRSRLRPKWTDHLRSDGAAIVAATRTGQDDLHWFPPG